LIAGAAFLAAIISCRNWRSGGIAVVLLAIIGGVAVIAHPNQQIRFIFSWFAAVRVAAATGTISTIYGRHLPIPLRLRSPIAAGVCVAAVVILMIYAFKPPPARPGVSDLDLSDAYLPALKLFRRVMFLSNMPIGQFVD
jgi:hypothetical protein